jgi:hypothetical protein
MMNFIEWMNQQKQGIPQGGWSKKTTVPVGMNKDTSPETPDNDPERNPAKHRGVVKTHIGKPENAPKHPKNAVDPK